MLSFVSGEPLMGVLLEHASLMPIHSKTLVHQQFLKQCNGAGNQCSYICMCVLHTYIHTCVWMRRQILTANTLNQESQSRWTMFSHIHKSRTKQKFSAKNKNRPLQLVWNKEWTGVMRWADIIIVMLRLPKALSLLVPTVCREKEWEMA